MSYVLNGRLQARCSERVVEPIANETVFLYWAPEGEASGFTVRSLEDARGREYLLLAQGRTDAHGNFRIEVTPDTLLGHRGSRREYSGGPVEVEVLYRGRGSEREPVQFSLGTVAPPWQESGGDRSARLEREISAQEIAAVRSELDIWTVHGTLRLSDGSSTSGYAVFAFDADVAQDDFLGSAPVAEDGTFRIDYPGSRFRPEPRGGIDFERGGPELYFKVRAPNGQTIFEEPRSRGNQPDRRRSPNWATADLSVDPARSSSASTPTAN
jgi:hypothetical protein